MPSYSIDDTYCPCGEKWTRVNASLIFNDYYYCDKCDKIFAPTIEEKTKNWFEQNYISDRRDELVALARATKAMSRVTVEDLKKLGYL